MKNFLKSKTLWTNAAIVGLAVAHGFGVPVPDGILDPTTVAVVNFALRLVTHQSLTTSKSN
jgi:hypothetical protein